MLITGKYLPVINKNKDSIPYFCFEIVLKQYVYLSELTRRWETGLGKR